MKCYELLSLSDMMARYKANKQKLLEMNSSWVKQMLFRDEISKCRRELRRDKLTLMELGLIGS